MEFWNEYKVHIIIFVNVAWCIAGYFMVRSSARANKQHSISHFDQIEPSFNVTTGEETHWK